MEGHVIVAPLASPTPFEVMAMRITMHDTPTV
jgi:hypothetical protein